MANLTEQKSNTLGNIAAIQTLLERYPVLITTNSLKSISGNTTSFNFMFDILQIIGVNNDKIVEWAANLISGNGENGILDNIETSIKTLLKANIKNMLSCTINPIIPDDLLDYHKVKNKYGDNLPNDIYTEGSGIEIDLSSIDFSGMLKIAPTSSIGKYYYFDNGYLPNDLYRSRDFNAFIWYVINKGIMSEEGNEKYKMIWDNRNKGKDRPNEDFFNALTPDDIAAYNKNNLPKKKQIIQCQFLERSFPNNNKLKIQLCSDTYYKTRKFFDVKNEEIASNKTLFEFNNDYIDSLKLFNSKVLMAQIIDKLTGSLALNVGYSINETVIQGKIDMIIKKIIEGDDTTINDCFYSFSNEEYDALVEEATLKHAGLYKYNGDNNSAVSLNAQQLLDSLSGISENSTLQEQTTTIKNAFTQISATIAQDGVISVTDSFNFGMNIIYQIIEQIMYAVISTILSPKVMILIAINSHLMGDELPSSIEDFLKSINNLLVAIVKEIKDLILEELFNFLIKELEPLISLYLSKLTLESIKYYKELLSNIIDACMSSNNSSVQGVIDNVNYADIVPQEITPESSIC